MGVAEIPLRTAIVDAVTGAINIFFRLRWEELRTAVGVVAAKALVTPAAVQSASVLTALLLTVTTPGIYRVTFTARRTANDGAGSSLQFVWHWTDGGTPLSKSAAVNNTDTTADLYSDTRLMPVDGFTNLTYDFLYTSTTPGQMKYRYTVTAELIASV